MEQGQPKQQAAPLRWLGRLMQVGLAEPCVCAQHIGLQPLQPKQQVSPADLQSM